MGDIFDVIGFKLPDEASYQQLAEAARQRGTPSAISRRNAIIQGYCWPLVEGVEIWTILHEKMAFILQIVAWPFAILELMKLLRLDFIQFWSLK